MHRFSFENAANSILTYTVYMESTNIGDTVYFTKRTGHLKMRYSLIFSLSENNKHTKLILNVKKLKKNIFQCLVRFVNKVCPILAYRASTITGQTVYFTKRTEHLKMLFLQFFLY